MATIQRLPLEVVNRMAAGEVLARPGNAIKELVENSLDAGSTEVVVHVEKCGMKMLQVSDNGKGICRDDFELVCERFATSKLRTFEDLSHMKTYGFRGEALASLSHVSRVNIVSKRKDENCAYQANFLDGKMLAPTKPSAGKAGTCVTATDLFYNLPQRRNKMLAHSEESKFIFETLMRFAVHRPDVSFALRQNHSSDFRTKGDGNFRNVVSLLIGSDISHNLINLNLDSIRLKFQFTGCMSKPISAATAKNSQNRRIRQNFFSVFINGRSVRCDILKQPMDEVLTAKSLICQFCAVDLKIDETRVDVNVHPTKSSVLFLEKEEIVEEIRDYLAHIVAELFEDTPDAEVQIEKEEEVENSSQASSSSSSSSTFVHELKSVETMRRPSTSSEFRAGGGGVEKKRVDYMEIRNDSKERKLDEFVIRCQPPVSTSSSKSSSENIVDSQSFSMSQKSDFLEETFDMSQCSAISQLDQTVDDEELDDEEENNFPRREFEFASLNELREEICEQTCLSLRELFKTFTFIGCVDPEKCLVQFGTSVYLLDLSEILKQFFYQVTIFNFGNFPSFKIEEPCPQISNLLEVLANLSREDNNYATFAIFENLEKIEDAENLLEFNSELFSNYFSIRFQRNDENKLVLSEIPNMVTHFCPQLEKLPFLIGALVMDVDYEEEKSCFSGIAKALADFFTIHKCFTEEKKISAFSDIRWESQIRQIIMPQLRKKLLPSETMKDNIQQLADAHDLYKVFERCGS